MSLKVPGQTPKLESDIFISSRFWIINNSMQKYVHRSLAILNEIFQLSDEVLFRYWDNILVLEHSFIFS